MGFDIFLIAAGEKALDRSSFIVELCRSYRRKTVAVL